jgi:hypothetical protein
MGMRPGDLVGAITAEARVPGSAIGAIQITDSFSLVDVSGDVVDRVIHALRDATIRGRNLPVRLDRDMRERRRARFGSPATRSAFEVDPIVLADVVRDADRHVVAGHRMGDRPMADLHRSHRLDKVRGVAADVDLVAHVKGTRQAHRRHPEMAEVMRDGPDSRGRVVLGRHGAPPSGAQ